MYLHPRLNKIAPMNTTIPHLVPEIPMLDIAKAKQFYCEQMGCTLLSECPDFLILELEGQEFQLWLCEDKAIPESSSIYIRTTDIDACYARYRHMPVVLPLQLRPWGIPEFYIMDVSGNLLKFGSVVTPHQK